MCGICGIVHLNKLPVNEGPVRKMMAAMKHRGPDDDGVFLQGNMGLGHVRLSILDLSAAGRQPMWSGDGRHVVVYNGEVYNYVELKKELGDYPFRTRTDTEVLLAAYGRWGLSCLHRFNGMFAFALYDLEKRRLILARDRFGIKPLYYYRDRDVFIFASEIAPILKVLEKRLIPDDRSVFDYLVFNRTDQTERTFLKNIKKLPHGHLLKIEEEDVRIEKWYDLKSRIQNPFTSPEEFRDTLSSSIGLRLRSDVPVGVCLSGGLDSSSIVSILLHDYGKTDLNTFSAVYGKDIQGDESEYIHEYRNALKNMFFTQPDANTLFKDLNKYIRAHNEPTPSTGPYAQFKVMELASKNVVVTLDGQGADEELGGYHYFFGYLFKELFLDMQFSALIMEIYHYVSSHRSGYGVLAFLYYLLPAAMKSRLRVREKGYLQPDFHRQYQDGSAVAEHLYGARGLREALTEHFEYKLEHLLKWEDSNSMWFSLEARVPFLDHRLVEKTLALGREWIISRGVTKVILRKGLNGILPESIRTRKDKIGFLTPEDDWFRTDKWKTFILDLLHSVSFARRGYIDPKRAVALYGRHLERKINISREIWKWINLEIWCRTFVENPGSI
jgi:asparagine synthase (glutamine-hydrolysing)